MNKIFQSFLQHFSVYGITLTETKKEKDNEILFHHV